MGITILGLISRTLRLLKAICLVLLSASAVIGLLSLALASLTKLSWPPRLGPQSFSVFIGSLAAFVCLWIVNAIFSQIILIGAATCLATVVDIRQVAAPGNSLPRFVLDLRVELPTGDVRTTLTVSLDITRIPHRGDRVQVRVSRADPTCIRYAGPAPHPSVSFPA